MDDSSGRRLGAIASILALALLGFGRYALGQNEDLGAMFYVVAPLALFGCLVSTIVALVLLPDFWRSAVALGLACLAAVFTAYPGTNDGPHAVMFGAYAVGLLLTAGSAAQRFRKTAPTGGDSTQHGVASAIVVVSRILVLVLMAIGLVTAVILIWLVVSGYEG
jgi:hypothetical protein